MQKRSILIVMASSLCCLISFEAITSSSGAPAARTGSPSSFGTCAAAGCHNGPSVTTESISITTDIPASGFAENTDYTITVTADDGGRNLSRIGFEASVENDLGAVGSVSPLSSGVQKIGSSEFVTHTLAGTNATGGSKSWDFRWNSGTAPDSATVYVAVNFSNNNGHPSGDVIHTEQSILRKDQGVGIDEWALSKLEIYPNPAADYLELKNLPASVEKLQILDLTGKVVLEITDPVSKERIDLESVNEGNYLLHEPQSGRALHFRVRR